MTLRAPRLPLTFDPLIAEAKRRARQRRCLLAVVVILVVAAAAGAALVNGSGGGPGLAPPGHRQPAQPETNVAPVRVPVDSLEREWRDWAASQAPNPILARGAAAVAPRFEREVEAAVQASEARLVRMKVWRTTSPPSMELVVLTPGRPAVYLTRRLPPLLKVVTRGLGPAALGDGFAFLEAVNRHGSMIFQWLATTRDRAVGLPRGLQMCGPVYADWIDSPPSCPMG